MSDPPRRSAEQPHDARRSSAEGNLLLRSGDLAGAEQAYRRAVELDPSVPGYRGALAEVLRRLGRCDDALRIFRQLIGGGDADAQIYGGFGRTLAQSGELGAAEEALRKAVGMGPAGHTFRSALADVLDRQGRREEAIGILRQLTAEGDTNPYMHNRLGQTLARSGDLPGAEQAYRKAIQLAPNVASFRSALAAVLQGQSRNEEAIAVLREAIANASDDPNLHASVANLLKQSGDLAGAEQALRAAARLDPNNEGHRYVLAVMLNQHGRRAESFAILCELVTGGAGGPIQLHFDRQLMWIGGLPGAERELRTALRASPDDAVLGGALAEVLHRQERNDEALGLLLSFAERGTQYAHIYARIGHLRAARGNLAGAAEALRKAVELQPTVTRFQTALADVLARQANHP